MEIIRRVAGVEVLRNPGRRQSYYTGVSDYLNPGHPAAPAYFNQPEGVQSFGMFHEFGRRFASVAGQDGQRQKDITNDINVWDFVGNCLSGRLDLVKQETELNNGKLEIN